MNSIEGSNAINNNNQKNIKIKIILFHAHFFTRFITSLFFKSCTLHIYYRTSILLSNIISVIQHHITIQKNKKLKCDQCVNTSYSVKQNEKLQNIMLSSMSNRAFLSLSQSGFTYFPLWIPKF